MSKKTILLTGSAGFIGSTFIEKLVKEYPQHNIVSIDKLVESYNIYNRKYHPKHTFYMGDITDEHFVDNIFKIEKPNIVINMCAESFVGLSITSAKPFIMTNTYGTQVLCDASVKYGVEKFIYISTDEIYGHLEHGDPSWTEESPPMPRNPYSASKYAGELVVYAANQTHGLQYNITRSCNIVGPRQPNRNLIPVVINSIMKNKTIPIQSDGTQSRCWDYVDNKCNAIMHILHHAPPNEVFNLGPGTELTNLETVNKICDYFGKGKSLIKTGFIRLGIDRRYHVNTKKLYDIGYKQEYSFEESFIKTMKWYEANPQYLDL